MCLSVLPVAFLPKVFTQKMYQRFSATMYRLRDSRWLPCGQYLHVGSIHREDNPLFACACAWTTGLWNTIYPTAQGSLYAFVLKRQRHNAPWSKIQSKIQVFNHRAYSTIGHIQPSGIFNHRAIIVPMIFINCLVVVTTSSDICMIHGRLDHTAGQRLLIQPLFQNRANALIAAPFNGYCPLAGCLKAARRKVFGQT